ncbi:MULTISPECIES: hypothetical protein [Corynebacterium]|uniref:Secreted protein n=1 Tax=Corynebacterium lipophilum TaxID=2804918 RepID=A0AAW5HWF6_9CORY|nr:MULTISPECIES: hypothetical protein [Corynebacterium]MCO6395385.1 hypothetical protein [Corynebacterium lipophilum]MCQ4607544.1 hypothetical protein [Corynebacterium pseudogenitalium]MCZ2118097.1 hypothetical protein [Corynebacterium lipophilum]
MLHTTNDDSAQSVALLRRVPTALFVAVYGALVVVLASLAVALYAYQHNAPQETRLQRELVFQPEAPQADIASIEASIRPYLIADAEVREAHRGAALRGDITDTAVQDVDSFAGHLSRLLQQNCIPGVELRTGSNLNVSLWDYCHEAPAPESIAQQMRLALSYDADFVGFLRYPSKQTTKVTWMNVDDDASRDSLVAMWKERGLPDGVDEVVYQAYGAGEVTTLVIDNKGEHPLHTDPTPDSK